MRRSRRLWFEALERRTLLSGPPGSDSFAVPAFPGAEGFGAQTVGGRGGRVIEVTTLNDGGPGSLRSALKAEGARTIVFRVGGTIELQSSLTIANPFVTIAGQTAPGDGITLKGFELRIRTHDVILRYLRIRTGPTADEDAVQLLGAENVILDHNSFSWATDENASATVGSKNVTFQWNIISEGLHNSTNTKGPHSKGSLLSGTTNVSIHHNLYAHNDARNPRIGNTDGSAGIQLVDVVNNVIYDWGIRATEAKSYVQANLVGNYFKQGPSSYGYTEDGTPEIRIFGDDIERSIFVEGNLGPNCPAGCLDDWEVVGLSGGKEVSRAHQSSARHAAPQVSTTSAQLAFDQVLAEAGATLPVRDAIDERVVRQVIDGTGRIIDDPSEVGGWLDFASGTPPADRDHDGAPDYWEVQYGFNPADPADGAQDADGDGYTNLEEFLNETNPRVDAMPLAADDAVSTQSNTTVTVSVLGNDVLGDKPSRIVAVTQPENGQVKLHSGEGTVSYMPGQNFVGSDSYTYTIMDGNGQTSTATVTVTVTDEGGGSLSATSLVPTSSGFVAEFNRELDTSTLNLYGTGAVNPDVVVIGQTHGPVAGSLVVDPSLRQINFVKSGDPLAPDTYTVTLRTGTDGFKDQAGNLLDGDGNGTAGDDLVRSFTIDEQSPNSAIVGLADFVRGPGQEVHLPADTTLGIPLTIRGGTGIRSASIRLDYDPALLNITAATVGADVPPGATVSLDTVTSPGSATLTFISPDDLPAGVNTIVNLQANVPATGEIYGLQQVLDIHDVVITDGANSTLPVIADDALHVVAYFGDVSGNRSVNTIDAVQVARFAAQFDSGFESTPLSDPVVVADVNGDGRITSADATKLAEFSAELHVPEIPLIPTPPIGMVGLGGLAPSPIPKNSPARTAIPPSDNVYAAVTAARAHLESPAPGLTDAELRLSLDEALDELWSATDETGEE